jgi:hypothetical protein
MLYPIFLLLKRCLDVTLQNNYPSEVVNKLYRMDLDAAVDKVKETLLVDIEKGIKH